jgi:hypothetical protein
MAYLPLPGGTVTVPPHCILIICLWARIEIEPKEATTTSINNINYIKSISIFGPESLTPSKRQMAHHPSVKHPATNYCDKYYKNPQNDYNFFLLDIRGLDKPGELFRFIFSMCGRSCLHIRFNILPTNNKETYRVVSWIYESVKRAQILWMRNCHKYIPLIINISWRCSRTQFFFLLLENRYIYLKIWIGLMMM